jgi:D-alanyl-D-alanine carboxypeptidase/D-alanyl-D-alanine-endopeptidase (penicillin-binding protein 4)
MIPIQPFRHSLPLLSLLTTAAPAMAAPPPVPLLSPPVPLEARGLPSLRDGQRCPALQRAVEADLGAGQQVWSISIVDGNGELQADVNGRVARVPASNQKLISTAYALDRLGPDFRLRTQLVRRPDGVLELRGQGDPDLGLAGLQRLAMAALGQGGSRNPETAAAPIKLMLREEPPQRWWPRDWEPADRAYAYGAPITRLALTSNALDMAVQNPAARFKTLFSKQVQRQGGAVQLSVAAPQPLRVTPDPTQTDGDGTTLLHEETSAPMHALLSLANTESHNFTAEVLLRAAANQWDVKAASREAMAWMTSQNLPVQGLRIADGSGLSRSNRVSSQTMAALLLHMHQHPLGPHYQASMAIAGRRGTLRNTFRGTSLEGRLWAKTGTLRGVRSVSGILQTADGPRFVSLISNGAGAPNQTIGAVLQSVQRLSPCPGSV